MEQRKRPFIGYEYLDVTVKRNKAHLYADSYENFGWELEGTDDPIGRVDSLVMKFRRDRKILNKVELTRLQHNFDACVDEITALEMQKYRKAAALAYAVGGIGTACMAGAVFAVTANRIVLCILLAIPAFLGWAAPYFLYRMTVRAKTKAAAPLIDQKYEEIYTVCEKAHTLLTPAGRPVPSEPAPLE